MHELSKLFFGKIAEIFTKNTKSQVNPYQVDRTQISLPYLSDNSTNCTVQLTTSVTFSTNCVVQIATSVLVFYLPHLSY